MGSDVWDKVPNKYGFFDTFPLVNIRENDNLFDNFGKALCTECLPFLFYPLYQQLPFGNSVVHPPFIPMVFMGGKQH